MFLFKKTEPKYRKVITNNQYMIWFSIGKKIFPRAMVCTLYPDQKRIFISDINIGDVKTYKKYINKGYGTHMMEMLLKFAAENNYEKITGILSPVDSSDAYDPTHRERQIHFYKKFGFTILPDENNPEEIELILKK